MEKTLQEKFDALIAEHGAEAVIEAAKAHSTPATGGGKGCPLGYYWSDSLQQCVLDVG